MAVAISDNVSKTIAPGDTMFVPGQDEQYFAVGKSAVSCIDTAVRAAGKTSADIKSVLDFPCGHGRVLRHLIGTYTNAKFTASDLDKDGVDFCQSAFGVRGVYSHVDPTQIPLPENEYDLIWVGSLLTHFDAHRWAPFFRFFASRLKVGGVLAFSTHGRTTVAWMENKVYDYALPPDVMADCLGQYKSKGFGYVQYVGSPLDYGVSLSTPSWVTGQLAQVPELRLVHYVEGGWVQHHDVVSCVRGPVFWP